MSIWLLAAAGSSACLRSMHVPRDPSWLPGIANSYAVDPARKQLQPILLKRLRHRAFEKVSLSFARHVTAPAKIAGGRNYYYLVKVEWAGDAPDGTVQSMPWPLDFGMNVSPRHVAYLGTVSDKASRHTSKFVAIITSPVSIRRIVYYCLPEK